MTQPDQVAVDADEVINELLATIAGLHKENAMLRVRVRSLAPRVEAPES